MIVKDVEGKAVLWFQPIVDLVIDVTAVEDNLQIFVQFVEGTDGVKYLLLVEDAKCMEELLQQDQVNANIVVVVVNIL